MESPYPWSKYNISISPDYFPEILIYFPDELKQTTNKDLQIYKGNIYPHWEMNEAIYHICFRLNDSIAQERLYLYIQEKERIYLRKKNSSKDFCYHRNLINYSMLDMDIVSLENQILREKCNLYY